MTTALDFRPVPGGRDRATQRVHPGSDTMHLLFAFLLAVIAPAHAHRLSHSEAWASFRADGGFEVDLFVDPDDLPGDPPADRAAREALLLDWYAKSVTLAFDGTPAPFETSLPAADTLPVPPRELAVVRLSGGIPVGAEAFTWHSVEDVGTIVLNLQQQGDPRAVLLRVPPGERSAPYPLTVSPEPPTAAQVAGTYLVLGFTHIVPKGLDHVLFVLGLFLASTRLRPLFWQITAFTAAHSLSLALSTLGLVRVSPAVVEPLIALSIAWVAVENALRRDVAPWRPVLVFAFGLLHGLGFAGVLGDLGLSPDRFATSLLGFNVGVELGQLAVVGAAFLLVGRFRDADGYRRWIVVPASALIGAMGAWWTVERVFLG